MAKIAYIEKRFRGSSQEIILKANQIIGEYKAQGFDLTLRQLYYQFVARDIIPNNQKEYKRLGSVINDARLAGLIDWNDIEDRTRSLRGFNHYENPGEFIDAMVYNYRVNHWDGQDTYVECWVEKDALVGVIGQICAKWDIDYFACRGYVSQSEQHEAAMRVRRKLRDGDHSRAVILHLGDHDPSGIDMSRDIQDRMNLFLGRYAGDFEVKRLALHMSQVEQYEPPPNPAKMTDSRFESYRELYGESSWELDALDPRVISDLIEKEVKAVIDKELFDERKLIQSQGRDALREAAMRFKEEEGDDD